MSGKLGVGLAASAVLVGALVLLVGRRDLPHGDNTQGMTGELGTQSEVQQDPGGAAEPASATLEYRIVNREDVNYLGAERMVYRVVVNVTELPSQQSMRSLAQDLWQRGNQIWDEFTVFLYLPDMDTNSLAYGIGKFNRAGLKEFHVLEAALWGTKWKR